jgi:hypothetical protein
MAATVPTIATARKLTELLMRKNATDRRAICSPGIPPWRSTHAPSARPAAPLAGTSAPTPSSDTASSRAVRFDMCGQKTGRNMST